MKPSVGRIVHYQTYGTPGGEYDSEPIAAIVTAVWTNGTTIDICAFYDNGLSFKTGVEPSPAGDESEAATEPAAGHWNWPPRS